jgi:hypothetical protein
MPANLRNRAGFSETFAVHAGLKFALAKKLFRGDPSAHQAAMNLVKSLESERSIYGRQLKMLRHMEAGATLDQMVKQLRCSRRTAFRYLDQLKAAGIGVTLKGHEYRVPRHLLKLVGR